MTVYSRLLSQLTKVWNMSGWKKVGSWVLWSPWKRKTNQWCPSDILTCSVHKTGGCFIGRNSLLSSVTSKQCVTLVLEWDAECQMSSPNRPTMKVSLRVFDSVRRKQKSDQPKHQHKDSSRYSSTRMTHLLLSAPALLKQRLNCCFVGKNPQQTLLLPDATQI